MRLQTNRLIAARNFSEPEHRSGIDCFTASALEQSLLEIGAGYSSPVFISSNVSNKGTRSITSFAALFNPVPNV